MLYYRIERLEYIDDTVYVLVPLHEEIGHSTSHKIVKNSVHNTLRIGANFYIDYNVNASNAGTNRFVETCYK